VPAMSWSSTAVFVLTARQGRCGMLTAASRQRSSSSLQRCSRSFSRANAAGPMAVLGCQAEETACSVRPGPTSAYRPEGLCGRRV
jgi:hypothetical protein